MAIPLGKPSDKADRPESAPDSVSRSVVREGAQAAARDTVKRGAHATAPAPQASLTVSRQPSLRVAAKCGVCVVTLLGFVVLATTFVVRLASIRILTATHTAEDLIRRSLLTLGNWHDVPLHCTVIKLSRPPDLEFLIADHFIPLRNPAHGARQRKNRCKHTDGNAQSPLHDT